MQISVVVLAGGKGTRLGGADKGLLEVNGRKMIEMTLDVVKPFAEQTLISCNRNMGDYMPLADSVVCDRISGALGPLAGIHAALESLSACAQVNSEALLLVLPCDTPLITTDIIKRLIAAAKASPNSIIVLADGEFLHPLHAIIPVKLKPSLEDFLLDDGRAVRKWYQLHEMVTVELEAAEQDALANVNTEQQLQFVSELID